MIARALLALALMAPGAAVAQSAPPPNWQPLNFLDETNERSRLVYLDRASLRTLPDGKREMRVALYFKKQQTLGGDTVFDWLEVTYRLDCAAKTMNVVKSSSMTPAGPVITSNNPGSTIPFASNIAYLRAAEIACDRETASLRQSTPSLPAHAVARFEHLAAVEGSERSTNWVRTDIGGKTPTRIALFLDRSSIVTLPNGERRATMMTIAETVGTSDHTMSSLIVNCAASTRRQLLSAGFKPGSRIVVFMEDAPVVVSSTTVIGTIMAPICTGDFSRTRAYPMLASTIRPTSFAQ